jgi:hypothetical protein
LIPTPEHAATSSPVPEHTAASTPTSECTVAILFLKLLVIVALPLLTSTLPPLERAAAVVDLNPASL